MRVRSYALPTVDLGDSCDAGIGADFLQLFLSGEVVANIVEVNLTVLQSVRVLHQQGYSNGSPAATSKNLTTLSTGQFTGGALISSQMEHIDAGKLSG
ncbi:hypothetical protein D3C85_1442840 [compost metagenome]